MWEDLFDSLNVEWKILFYFVGFGLSAVKKNYNTILTIKKTMAHML
jgi:hypothetical protein